MKRLVKYSIDDNHGYMQRLNQLEKCKLNYYLKDWYFTFQPAVQNLDKYQFGITFNTYLMNSHYSPL